MKPKPPENVEGAEGLPTIPPAHSVACRVCGTPVGFEGTEEGGAVTCECGTVNVLPEEMTVNAAD